MCCYLRFSRDSAFNVDAIANQAGESYQGTSVADRIQMNVGRTGTGAAAFVCVLNLK